MPRPEVSFGHRPPPPHAPYHGRSHLSYVFNRPPRELLASMSREISRSVFVGMKGVSQKGCLLFVIRQQLPKRATLCSGSAHRSIHFHRGRLVQCSSINYHIDTIASPFFFCRNSFLSYFLSFVALLLLNSQSCSSFYLTLPTRTAIMVFESTVLVLLKNWVLVIPVVLVIYLASNYFNHGLNKYPGPLLAGLTDWWRFFDVYGRRPDITHIKLHRKHGDVVRLGPNSLSFADPKAIKQIYGLNKGFVKVRTEPARS